ncbi:hypothetical protein HZZ13_03075 [Bradyrhizobium sp. CNPSo 4010]|uniref:Uncharacterized protein n=1 Tax=Bradyrhizobium agreste TaxID=2751811 RepID=A0ABS0PHU4_9BRAD|nr:hypothetical protein [Bradyrhizobium agreste]MBH5396778.1 hypothetical protein [Bradyrhizobium agreste]
MEADNMLGWSNNITEKRPQTTTGEHQSPALAVDTARTDVESITAFDVFSSELPDEAFEGVFDQPRQIYKPVDLSFRG